MHTPRGKVLGGSSSINGLVYVRGNPLDFDALGGGGRRAAGAIADVLPYFRRAETREEGGDAYRGDDGPLHTRYGTAAEPAARRPGSRPARQAGYPLTDDYQRLPAGRLRPDGHDRPRRPPLQRRQRLSQAGDDAAATSRSDARARDRNRVRGQPRRRRPLPRGTGSEHRGARAPRGDPLAAARSTRRNC